MASSAPGFWTVWLWKLGMWGLVVLFAFLYLGSVEKHRGDNRGDTGGDPVARAESVAAAGAGLGNSESGVDAPVVEHATKAEGVGEERAATESGGATDVDVLVSEPYRSVLEGVGQAGNGQNEPVPEVVSHAEAQAFANAVMSETVADSTEVGSAGAARNSPGVEPTAEPGPALQSDVPDAAAGAPRVAVRETAAQRRARIMAEYRSMQSAARAEMRKRWSNMRGTYPYGAYPRWSYPQGVRPKGYAPAGQ